MIPITITTTRTTDDDNLNINNYSIDSLDDNHDKNDDDDDNNNNKDVLIPFYRGNIKLSEFKKIRQSARKKIKSITKCSTKEINELYLPLDKISNNNSIDNTIKKSKSIELNLNTDTTTTKTRRQTTRTFNTLNDSIDNNNINQRKKIRGKSVSYLEQYRKKIDIKNKKQIKNGSVCSTIGTITTTNDDNSSNRTITLDYNNLSLKNDYYSQIDNDDYDDDGDETFYQEILNNKFKNHSSPKNTFYDDTNNSNLLRTNIFQNNENNLNEKKINNNVKMNKNEVSCK